jgi:hypothetical protein
MVLLVPDTGLKYTVLQFKLQVAPRSSFLPHNKQRFTTSPTDAIMTNRRCQSSDATHWRAWSHDSRCCTSTTPLISTDVTSHQLSSCREVQ